MYDISVRAYIFEVVALFDEAESLLNFPPGWLRFDRPPKAFKVPRSQTGVDDEHQRRLPEADDNHQQSFCSRPRQANLILPRFSETGAYTNMVGKRPKRQGPLSLYHRGRRCKRQPNEA